MKILHVLYSGLGGHGNIFFSMAGADTQKEFEFEALFNGIEEVKKEYLNKCTEGDITWHFVKKKPGLDLTYYRQLYQHIKKAKPQVIFLHGGAAAIPAWLAKITTKEIKKIIVRETQANHLKTKSDWLYLSTAMLLANKVAYLSEAYKQQIKSRLSLLYSEKRTALIPNGIDLAVFHKSAIRPNRTQIVLGMQSRLISIKDHTTLLEAFALMIKKELPAKVILKIAGDGDYKEKLMQLSVDLNIADKVFFTGMLEEKELVDFLQEVDIYIHASLGETMSTAIMQAMACGKPIVASDVMGINNMIENNVTGVLVPVKNANAMVDALTKMIDNPQFAGEVAANAFSFAQANYSNAMMLDKYKMLFTD